MSTETAGTTGTATKDRAWAPWLRALGIALALLVVSEAVWVWQTWPVRELLQPAPAVPHKAAKLP